MIYNERSMTMERKPKTLEHQGIKWSDEGKDDITF